MATNTGHHLMCVSLLTEIYIVVATIYPRLMEQFFLPDLRSDVVCLIGGVSWVGLPSLCPHLLILGVLR